MSKKHASRYSNLQALEQRSSRDFERKIAAKGGLKAQILNADVFQQAMLEQARAIETANKNPCWDELNHTAADCELLIAQHAALAAQASDEAILANIKNLGLLQSNIELLSRDLGDLNNKYQRIRALHSARSGNAKDPDDLMESIFINQQYATLIEHHQGVVMPTAMHITEQVQEAEEQLRVNDPETAMIYRSRISDILTNIAERARVNSAARQATQEKQTEIAAAEALVAAQDPTVVTDVEVKVD